MSPSDKDRQLTPEDLSLWINGGKAFYLIHTLGEDHFKQVHLPGALQVCVFEVSFLEQIEAIVSEKSAVVVVYGSSTQSNDAAKAFEKLENNGYTNVYFLQGGIESWRDAGYPLEGESAGQHVDPQTELELSDGTFSVDTDQSWIEWVGRNPFTRHFGTIDISSGEIVVIDGFLTGRFSLDMDSITNTSLKGDELQPVLDSHLKSDDFFLTTLFPEAIFTIQEARPVIKPFLSAQNVEVLGQLEVRGITAYQDFMATVMQTSKKGLIAEAHFDIDRTRWNVIYGSTRFFEHLGMHLIFDQISIQVKIVAS